MKKILLTIGLILILPHSTHAQTNSETVTVEAVPAVANLVITRPSDQTHWLLKLKAGCASSIKADNSIKLIVNGALNAHQDQIKVGTNKPCAIEKAYEWNTRLTVDYAYKNEGRVVDEKGDQYSIIHINGCTRMRTFRSQTIYALKQGGDLAAGDQLITPGTPKKCTLRFVKKLEEKTVKKEVSGDTQKPTRVTHVRAFPRNGAAQIYWRPAQDNSAIDHYVISYSNHRMDPKKLTLDNAPNQHKTSETNIRIEGLKGSERYYFYVLAVDTSNNHSSFWSRPSSAFVHSSISPDFPATTKTRELNLRKIYESKNSIITKWKRPPATAYYNVTLREITPKKTLHIRSYHNYSKNRFRLLKRAYKNKEIELMVSAYSARGLIEVETIRFKIK